MDLLRTQKIRYLVAFYRKLQKSLGAEQRLELIGEVINVMEKEPLSPHRTEVFINAKCIFFNKCIQLGILQLVDLLQREQNLILAGTSFSTVETLRKRQLILMVNIIKLYDRRLKTIPRKGKTCQLNVSKVLNMLYILQCLTFELCVKCARMCLISRKFIWTLVNTNQKYEYAMTAQCFRFV